MRGRVHRREESGEKLKQSDRKPPSQEKMRSFDELSATMPTGKDSNTAPIVKSSVVDPYPVGSTSFWWIRVGGSASRAADPDPDPFHFNQKIHVSHQCCQRERPDPDPPASDAIPQHRV